MPDEIPETEESVASIHRRIEDYIATQELLFNERAKEACDKKVQEALADAERQEGTIDEARKAAMRSVLEKEYSILHRDAPQRFEELCDGLTHLAAGVDPFRSTERRPVPTPEGNRKYELLVKPRSPWVRRVAFNKQGRVERQGARGLTREGARDLVIETEWEDLFSTADVLAEIEKKYGDYLLGEPVGKLPDDLKTDIIKAATHLSKQSEVPDQAATGAQSEVRSWPYQIFAPGPVRDFVQSLPSITDLCDVARYHLGETTISTDDGNEVTISWQKLRKEKIKLQVLARKKEQGLGEDALPPILRSVYRHQEAHEAAKAKGRERGASDFNVAPFGASARADSRASAARSRKSGGRSGLNFHYQRFPQGDLWDFFCQLGGRSAGQISELCHSIEDDGKKLTQALLDKGKKLPADSSRDPFSRNAVLGAHDKLARKAVNLEEGQTLGLDDMRPALKALFYFWQENGKNVEGLCDQYHIKTEREQGLGR